MRSIEYRKKQAFRTVDFALILLREEKNKHSKVSVPYFLHKRTNVENLEHLVRVYRGLSTWPSDPLAWVCSCPSISGSSAAAWAPDFFALALSFLLGTDFEAGVDICEDEDEFVSDDRPNDLNPGDNRLHFTCSKRVFQF